MGCGGSAELKEMRQEMKAMRAELETVHEDRKQLQHKVKGLEAQGEQLQDKGLVTKPGLARKPSLAERRALSQLSLAGADGPTASPVAALTLPGAIFKDRSEDERCISDASTCATFDSLPRISVDSDTSGPSESLPIHAWYPEDESPQLKPRRRKGRSITEASPFAGAGTPLAGEESPDMKVTIQMKRGSFKTLRFNLDTEGDAPVQPSIEIAPQTSVLATQADPPSRVRAPTEPEPAQLAPEPAQRRRRRSLTESWGGDQSEAKLAEAAGLWTRRSSSLLDKANMGLPSLSLEKLATTLDPASPKRHRGRCRTRPSTWDAKDLEGVRKSAEAFEGGRAA